MKLNAVAEYIHADKYRTKGESFREAMQRVANYLKDGDAHYREFRDILLNQRFLPGGRIQGAAGSIRKTTEYNCYVSGTIEDSFTDGAGCIMNRAKEAAQTMRMGGGIGYDFSTLRPRGAMIKKLQSHSSGPISFMQIFNALCDCISSSGHRRGAQMGVLRIDHPDIMEFIHAKQNENQLTGFNISVAVTDEFMECLQNGKPFHLRFGGDIYEEVDPSAIWEALMRSTWDWAEPGVIFIDTINKQNNLYYCETIAATNPCGEQPLPPFGACLLGSFNLANYVERGNAGDLFLNIEHLKRDVPAVVRAMDNIIDRARYPLYEQEKEAKNKRRMGLGVTGLANALEALGNPYGSAGFLAAQDEIMSTIRDESYKASVELAKEKGVFPLFDRDKYCYGEFIQTLPGEIVEAIYAHGIRNSHLLSIAPTGTISICANNVSSGIEPVFSYEVERTIREFDGDKIVKLQDYGFAEFGTRGKTTDEVTIDEHLAVLTTASYNVDSAVSKTCNIPDDIDWEDFKDVYLRAWRHGCKGVTTYKKNGKRKGILNDTGKGCKYDPVTGIKECE